MVCDIVDPIVKSVLFPENPPANFLRSECDILGDGWFGNGTIAKAKTIIRGKIHTLTQQNREADDAEFQCVLGLPDHARGNDENLVAFHMDPETATSREMALATEVRATIKGVASWQKLVAETRAGGNFPWVTADGREKQGASVVDQKTDAATLDQEVDDEAAATRRVMEEEEAEAEVDEDEEDAFMREDIAAIANTQAEQANSERRDQQERTIMEDDEDDEEDDDAEGRSEDSDDDEDEDEDV
jgi:general transcription factor 3C polypeptide 5 (transcription factor C subunit 1)